MPPTQMAREKVPIGPVYATPKVLLHFSMLDDIKWKVWNMASRVEFLWEKQWKHSPVNRHAIVFSENTDIVRLFVHLHYSILF